MPSPLPLPLPLLQRPYQRHIEPIRQPPPRRRRLHQLAIVVEQRAQRLAQPFHRDVDGVAMPQRVVLVAAPDAEEELLRGDRLALRLDEGGEELAGERAAAID